MQKYLSLTYIYIISNAKSLEKPLNFDYINSADKAG